ncbi:Zinc finger protein [Plakobranchus ocellatus]|uniref:Zinc finger protein n=1 Tax=Plakobranchus ocellatus TaxID=259542 RepID=A0AAV4CCT3_9GAST|nr:Zinc finger protein [Plakobranchus ocellatus]
MNYVVESTQTTCWSTPQPEDHEELSRRLQQANFTVRPTKSVLAARTIDFLNHRLEEGAISLQSENVGESSGSTKNQDLEGARAFLGFVGYCKNSFLTMQ